MPVTLAGGDIDGDPLEFVILTLPPNGVLTADATEVVSVPFSLNLETVTYLPNAGFNGFDVFTFKVTDGALDSVAATVSIIVNDAPVADDRAVSTDEDTELMIPLTGTDVNGDRLEFVVLTLPTNGVLTLGVGTLTSTPFSLTLDSVVYTPNADFNGADSFTFKVNDGITDSNEAEVSITVNPLNDAPVAEDRTVSVGADAWVGINLTGGDIDGDSLEFIVLMLPANGVLTAGTEKIAEVPFVLTGDTVVYTPDVDFNGSEVFTFGVSDGALSSNVATVSITVDAGNGSPAAHDLRVSTHSDRSDPAPLDGATVSGDIFVFVDPDRGGIIEEVEFYLDDPDMVNEEFKEEEHAPFDLAGGSVDSAKPFDTTRIGNGPHTITATIELDDETVVVTSIFTVAN